MSSLKSFSDINVLQAAKERINFTFNNFNKIYVAFSAGKDSTVMLHLVMEEAKKRSRKVGLLLVDLEAQYSQTIEHALSCIETYKDNLEVYWVCLPISLRNAVSNFEPKWICWEEAKQATWVRQPPDIAITDINYFPFFSPGYEFEEFVPEFGEWYAQGEKCACLVGIRADESLNRFRTIATDKKERFQDKSYTTRTTDNVYSIYPIYDWKVSDIWTYHYKNPDKRFNEIYEQMHKAGLSPAQMRICQPYGDDQKRGLWLYHILEPATWYKVVARVNGANSGALYAQETGNITGRNKIVKPSHHTWKSFCEVLLKTLPPKTRNQYLKKFKTFVKWWKANGYPDGIPDEGPEHLEAKREVPSWRRMCKVILRNDYWCKGLSFSQPKSDAYKRYQELKRNKTLLEVDEEGENEDL